MIIIKKLLKHTRKKSYFLWIVSYFAFVALLLVISGIITVIAKQIIQDEINYANFSAFSTINANINAMKSDLNRLAVRLSFNDDITNLITKKNITETADFHSLYLQKQIVNESLLSYDYIDETGFFLKNSEKILIEGGLLDAQTNFNQYLFITQSLPIVDYDSWKEFVFSRHMQEIYVTKDGNVFYIQSLPFENRGEYLGALIFKISPDKFNSIANIQKDAVNNVFMLLNNVNDCFFSSAHHEIVSKVKTGEVTPKEGRDVIKIDNYSYVVYTSKKTSNIRCVLAISEDAYWSKLNKMMNTIALFIVISTLLALCLAIIFSKKHYSGIAKIVNLISKTQATRNDQLNEFEYVEQFLQNILKKVHDNERFKDEYNSFLFQEAFRRYLTGQMREIHVGKIMKRFNINYTYSNYCVALISVDDFSDYIADIEPEGITEKKLIEVAFENVINEVTGEKYSNLIVGMEEGISIFCLMGWDKAIDQYSLSEIEKNVNQAIYLLREKLGISCSSTISDVFHELEYISKAYAQAKDAYACTWSVNGSVVLFREITWEEGKYKFTIDHETQLVSFITNGDYQGAKALVNEVFLTNGNLPNTSEKLEFLKCDIISTCTKTMHYKELYEDDEYKQLFDQIKTSKTMNSLKNTTLILLERICTTRQQNAQLKKNMLLGERVREFVDLNYADPNLNVNLLGQHFELSPNYLSKTFKLQTGEILRDYIVNCRLNAAKLLLASNLKLEEIAQKSGFISAAIFIRTFKKHFDITPGKFRENL